MNSTLWWTLIDKGTDNAEIFLLDRHYLKKLRTFYQHLYEVLSQAWHDTFMHWRTKDELWKILKENRSDDISDGNKHFFWLESDGKLIWTSFLQICDAKKQEVLNTEFPNSPFNLFQQNPEAKIAILWGDGITPTEWGKWRNRKMVEYRCQIAKENNCDYAVSIVDCRNKQNMSPYLKNKFFVAWIGKDPSDGGDIIYLVRDLKTDKKRPSPIIPQYWYYSKKNWKSFYLLKAA